MPVGEMLKLVWTWKEAAYQDTKDMSPAERIEYFRDARNRFEKRSGAKLDLPEGRRHRRGSSA